MYDHTFTPLQSPGLPSFTVQANHGSGCQNWIGCTVGGATISVDRGGVVDFSANIVSQRPKEAVAAAAPSYSNLDAWAAPDVVFTFNGVSRIKFEDFRIEISNDIEPVHTLNGQRWASSHVARGFEVTGVVNFVFDSFADMRRLWGAADATTPQKCIGPGSLAVSITHPTAIAESYYYSLIIDLPCIYYSTAPANITSARERIIQTVAFIASFDNVSNKLIDAVLRNSESGYPDPV